MGFLDDIFSKVKGMFSPQTISPIQNVSQPVSSYVDPYVKWKNDMAQIDRMQNQLETNNPQEAASSKMLDAYYRQNGNSFLPAQSPTGSPNQPPSSGQMAYAAPSGGNSPSYQAPRPQTDPNQLMALFSMLGNLQRNGQSQQTLPQLSMSTTPYTSAANNISSTRMNNEQSVLPGIYGKPSTLSA